MKKFDYPNLEEKNSNSNYVILILLVVLLVLFFFPKENKAPLKNNKEFTLDFDQSKTKLRDLQEGEWVIDPEKFYSWEESQSVDFAKIADFNKDTIYFDSERYQLLSEETKLYIAKSHGYNLTPTPEEEIWVSDYRNYIYVNMEKVRFCVKDLESQGVTENHLMLSCLNNNTRTHEEITRS